MFTVASNPCRSVHIEFIPGTEQGSEVLNSTQGTASVVQESRDPVSLTVQGQSLGTLDTELVPGQSWSFNTDQTKGGGARLLTWYVNGTASCYSATPLS
jgi:hypothetical protein